MQHEKLSIQIDALKEKLLNLLTIWYKEQTETLQHIIFIYENIFGNMEIEIEQKEKNSKKLEQKYKILANRINKNEPISRKSIEFIDKLLAQNDIRDKNNPHRHYNYKGNNIAFQSKNNILDTSLNDNINLTNIYRSIVKRLHPDIIGESNIFNLCWSNVQFCYNKQDADRLKMFYLILCVNNNDEMELEKEISELKKCIEKQNKDNNELKLQEPFCFADKLNNKQWIIERKNELRNKLVQVNKRIVHHNRLLRQIKVVEK